MKSAIAGIVGLFVILGSAFSGIQVADNRYAPMSVATELQYKSFYDYLEKAEKARAEGNEALAREYERQMERLKAQICKQDPAWERC
jgi:hypothetical protein